MRQDNMKVLAPDETYRHIVLNLIAQYDWKLVSPDQLIDLVSASTGEGDSSPNCKRIAINHYTQILYESCQQTKDLARREQGYRELFCYLFRAAYNRWPEMAEDVTQRALVLIHEQIDRCQHPGAFLAFALNKLRHACQQETHARGREIVLEKVEPDNSNLERSGPSTELDQKEDTLFLIDKIKVLLPERERQIILWKYFYGDGDEAIATRLGITPGYVRVLRHRAIQKLRSDTTLREYFSK